ncbi:MAG: valine--tRNA ligase [Euryarchaeota archaeon RBG_19FT_COMBO_56_21]|nr:MAG: valine--tRNA ligase [Euryarchaeota archaeon RBG_19FT_COMBO_56_21]
MAQYDWKESEPKWQAKWKEWEIYRFDPGSDKQVYSIDNPPRYASGALHLGHAYGYTVIDFAARYKRLRGFNVFFPLCFDVNGTPVEVRVEKVKGIKAHDIPRQEFIKMCSEFAETYIGEMTKQFETLGESMDPSIYYQTDAIYYRKLTQVSFIRMFKKGLVYKGHFPINWCTRCGTALADAEVDYAPRKTKLNFIKFAEVGTGREVMIATTRPELLCTCLMVAVHPDDASKADLVGKELITPMFDRKVKVVTDPKVDPDFGTGTVMICSIGDKDDLEWIMKYGLPLDKGIDESGKMTPLCGKYAGMAVADARKAIIEDMKKAGLLVKQEDLDQNIGVCWRCHTPIEFLKVPQWFIRSVEFKERVLEMVDKIVWKPEFMKIRIKDWINSLAWDWVVSRQRYFATAIPLWECDKCGDVIIAEEKDCYVDPTVTPARVERCKCGGRYVGSPDVFDTWMDSSISPLYNTFWERDEHLFKKLYPMTMRPQSHDIIRTWAYYTILREMLLIGEKPWNEVMIHGFIMAPDGTPMHASAGNTIDPKPLLEKYGGDAMRYYASTCSLGMDHAFKEQELVRGNRLATKAWNVMRLVGSACKTKPSQPSSMHPIDQWILSRFGALVHEVEKYNEAYEFDKAMARIEDFLWHEFADHYIELSKHRAYSEQDEGARFALYTVGLGLLKMISVFLPHVAEDAYQSSFKQHEGSVSIHVSGWPAAPARDKEGERKGEAVKEIVAAVRAWKSSKGMSLNAEIGAVEIVGPLAGDLISGSEMDMGQTLKAKSLVALDHVKLREIIERVKPVHSKLGPAFKRDAKEIVDHLQSLKNPDMKIVTDGVTLRLNDGREIRLSPEFFVVEKKILSEKGELDHIAVADLSVLVYR